MSVQFEPSDVDLLGASLLLIEQLGEAAAIHSRALEEALGRFGLEAANDRSPRELLDGFCALAWTRVADRAAEQALPQEAVC